MAGKSFSLDKFLNQELEPRDLPRLMQRLQRSDEIVCNSHAALESAVAVLAGARAAARLNRGQIRALGIPSYRQAQAAMAQVLAPCTPRQIDALGKFWGELAQPPFFHGGPSTQAMACEALRGLLEWQQTHVPPEDELDNSAGQTALKKIERAVHRRIFQDSDDFTCSIWSQALPGGPAAQNVRRYSELQALLDPREGALAGVVIEAIIFP